VLKTPFPESLLLEPPVFFEKLCQKPVIHKILVRHYSPRKGPPFIFSEGSKTTLYLLVGTSSAVASAIGADIALGSAQDRVSYFGRVLDRSEYGWHTTDPDTRRKMRALQEIAGYDKSGFINPDGTLDRSKVHKAYTDWESGPARERERLLEERLNQQDQEIRSQRDEIRSQRDEIRSQRDEIRSQRDEIRSLYDRLESYEKEVSIK
jgi:hypothetical protein